jgi:hypothetical protein
MYVYRREGDGRYAVGYWIDGKFMVASRHEERVTAQQRVHYLNGGNPHESAPAD